MFGRLLPSGINLPVPPLPDPVQLELRQSLLRQTRFVVAGFALGILEFQIRGLPALKEEDVILELEKL